jgi:hypothetical protein
MRDIEGVAAAFDEDDAEVPVLAEPELLMPPTFVNVRG